MSSLFIKSRSKSQAVLAKAGVSCLIVERVGWDVDAMKISSKPINLTCSGTLIPFSCKATNAPYALQSFVANIHGITCYGLDQKSFYL